MLKTFSVQIINLNSLAKKPKRSEGKEGVAGENFFKHSQSIFHILKFFQQPNANHVEMNMR